MASEPDPDRLKALEEKLQKVKGKEAPRQTATAKGFSQGEVAWRMVIELATGIGLGFAIGYGIDVLLGTLPIFLVIFTLFGFAAGILRRHKSLTTKIFGSIKRLTAKFPGSTHDTAEGTSTSFGCLGSGLLSTVIAGVATHSENL